MRRGRPEADLQATCAAYLEAVLDPREAYFTSIGHGAFLGDGVKIVRGRAVPLRVIRAKQLKKIGVKSGVADLLLTWRPVPDGDTLCFGYPAIGWIELKSNIGRQSPEQRDFAARMRWLYHHYAIVRSIDELIATLDEWGVPTKAKRKAAA